MNNVLITYIDSVVSMLRFTIHNDHSHHMQGDLVCIMQHATHISLHDSQLLSNCSDKISECCTIQPVFHTYKNNVFILTIGIYQPIKFYS